MVYENLRFLLYITCFYTIDLRRLTFYGQVYETPVRLSKGQSTFTPTTTKLMTSLPVHPHC